jgi:hypothetical protein
VTAPAAIVRLSAGGGAFMQRRMFAGLFLVSLFIAAGGGAQQAQPVPPDSEKPVWTMEFIKVKPGMFGFTLGYLDDNRMRVLEQAKRQGAVLSYHRIAEQGNKESSRVILLLTEYKNSTAYDTREKLFATIRKQLPRPTSGVIRLVCTKNSACRVSIRRMYFGLSILLNQTNAEREGRYGRVTRTHTSIPTKRLCRQR